MVEVIWHVLKRENNFVGIKRAMGIEVGKMIIIIIRSPERRWFIR